MKTLLTIFFILLSLSSCSGKKENVDEYYTDHGGWDDIRFPIIKPYEAICLNGSHDWIVQVTQNADGIFSAPNTRKINIVNHVILLYSTKTILNYADAQEAWFVLIPDKHIEKGFATHEKYLNYLHNINIKYEPKLYDMDQVSKYFGSHDTVDWQHIDN